MRFYGFLSNQTTAALVGPDGSVDWLPLPRFDAPAVFARLLGEERHGFFRVSLEGAEVRRQRYLPRTNLLETEWVGPDGHGKVVDYLVLGAPELRRVVDATVPVRIELRPAFGYGMVQPAVRPVGLGAVYSNPLSQEALVFAIRARRRLTVLNGDAVAGVWRLPPGRYEVVLHYVAHDRREGRQLLHRLEEEAAHFERQLEQDRVGEEALNRHRSYWRRIVPPSPGPFQAAVERSLLVLYGLCYRTTGAFVAAPTTSLPEAIGQSRQWDYRFVWIRDGSYIAEALLEAGDVVAPRRFLEFLFHCLAFSGKPFQAPFYHVDGTLIRGEEELAWLPGFRHSRPVREGNAASHQLQLDIEGDFLWLVYRFVEVTGDLPWLRYHWPGVEALVEWVARHWNTKDASLWEFRGQDDHYTHSKLMCWVALHYGAALADRVGKKGVARRWGEVADRLRAAIECQGFNPTLGHYVQTFGGTRLDAALLLLPLYGFCPPDDPRFLATLAAIEQTLVRGHWVYRYAEDMWGKAVHPFVLASSWLARVYLRLGRLQDARQLLEALVASATDLGLLGEHADQLSGEPRGNFPQAFSHLGVVLAALEYRRAVLSRRASGPVLGQEGGIASG
ncbi:MAG: glycoside hydrolase family 15 protein [Firmicutes bacterium]|nr:glycoside hydrolase family 15 protein [Alicyclobacillaceae bacterium]MCL6497925.1 glycoside hydrolase family 15 protein [Bacillota bacterium]